MYNTKDWQLVPSSTAHNKLVKIKHLTCPATAGSRSIWSGSNNCMTCDASAPNELFELYLTLNNIYNSKWNF